MIQATAAHIKATAKATQKHEKQKMENEEELKAKTQKLQKASFSSFLMLSERKTKRGCPAAWARSGCLFDFPSHIFGLMNFSVPDHSGRPRHMSKQHSRKEQINVGK